jgi:hypothetical protein
VVPIIQEKYPNTELIICGDSDVRGKEVAEKVAHTFNLKLALPIFSADDKSSTDFNDLQILSGKDVVKEQAEKAEKVVKKNGLGLKSLSELLAEPEEDVTWVVDGILPAGGLSGCIAKPKAGKSTLTRQLITAVATGTPFLNKKTNAGVVIHIVLEGLKRELTDHYKLMCPSGNENIKIHFGSRPEKPMEWLEKICEYYKPQLVVIDTLFKFVDVSDLNDYVKVNKAIDPMFDLSKKYNVHIMGIHHSRKSGGEDGDAALGSTAFFGSIDTLINLTNKEGKSTIDTRQRLGERLEPTVLNFDKLTKTFDVGMTVVEDKSEKASEEILDYLTSCDYWVTEKEIKEEVSYGNTIKVAALRKLLAEHKIQRRGKGKAGNPYEYAKLGLMSELESKAQEVEMPRNYKD